MNLFRNFFTDRHPKGQSDGPPPVKIAPFIKNHVRERVRCLVGRLGLHELADSSELDSVVALALERVRCKHGDGLRKVIQENESVPEDVVLVLSLREALKVLAGSTYKKHIHAAVAASDDARRTELFDQLTTLLQPEPDTCDLIDPAGVFDPWTWAIESVSVRHKYELYLRLSLLVTGMLCQEAGIDEMKMTVGEVVVLTTRRRDALRPVCKEADLVLS